MLHSDVSGDVVGSGTVATKCAPLSTGWLEPAGGDVPAGGFDPAGVAGDGRNYILTVCRRSTGDHFYTETLLQFVLAQLA